MKFQQIAVSANNGTVFALGENGCVYQHGTHKFSVPDSTPVFVNGWTQLEGPIGCVAISEAAERKVAARAKAEAPVLREGEE